MTQLKRFQDWIPGKTIQVPACWDCTHLFLDVTIGEVRCAAFPDGVPVDIRKGENRHTEPMPGDGGIQYEQLRDWPIAERPWDGCETCVHHHGDGTCAAYPKRIPMELLSRASDHTDPRPGQRPGFLYKSTDESR